MCIVAKERWDGMMFVWSWSWFYLSSKARYQTRENQDNDKLVFV